MRCNIKTSANTFDATFVIKPHIEETFRKSVSQAFLTDFKTLFKFIFNRTAETDRRIAKHVNVARKYKNGRKIVILVGSIYKST